MRSVERLKSQEDTMSKERESALPPEACERKSAGVNYRESMINHFPLTLSVDLSQPALWVIVCQ